MSTLHHINYWDIVNHTMLSNLLVTIYNVTLDKSARTQTISVATRVEVGYTISYISDLKLLQLDAIVKVDDVEETSYRKQFSGIFELEEVVFQLVKMSSIGRNTANT